MIRARSLAAAQTIPCRGDVPTNIERHTQLIDVAAREGAEVVVFPELSLTGYELDLADTLAFSEADPRLAPLVELAAVRALTVVVGAPARVGTRLHIGAFILSRDGRVDLYTKRHLGEGEELVVAPGDLDPLVDLGGHSAAVAVCADTNRPSHAREAARRGASTYLVSTFLTPEQLAPRTATLRDYAARHAMTVVLANHGGPSGGLAGGGGSAIWSASGERLAGLDGAGAGLVVAVEGGRGWRAEALPLDG